ncbi:MAG: tyrosine protein phosphatase [Alphaproteobacteria bacterium PA2]|nr:MAG: tyrosine protein phosphatase [Alphaproteobacteria bacterium PA2]
MFWIEAEGPGRLSIAARPRAGDWLEDEVSFWRQGGVDIVVSLLEAHEIFDLDLRREAEVCEAAGMTFLSLPIPDRGVPESLARTRELILACQTQLLEGKGVLVHCRAGIGRSSMIAACILKSKGLAAEAAFALISVARGLTVPDTPGQAQWADDFTLG